MNVFSVFEMHGKENCHSIFVYFIEDYGHGRVKKFVKFGSYELISHSDGFYCHVEHLDV
jgi:hypothetical protein